MKTLVVVLSVLALAGTSLQTARAGDREWATVGKILTGVAIGAVVAGALDAAPVHASVSYTCVAPAPCPPPAVVYCPPPPPPVVYCPPPPPPPVLYCPPPRRIVVYEPACPPAPVVFVKKTHPRHGWTRCR
ncbi:MAG: hypothetical protein N3I86_14290 [Verrucomicrobiae bacterium]|nr:hypothetical protein [Verrucomicrobiae bacterium]